MKFRPLLLAGLLAISAASASAQSYITAGGFRVGNTFGLTLNQRLANKWSGEFMLHSDYGPHAYTHFLLRRHVPLLTKNFNLYYGGGFHTGWDYSTRVDRDRRFAGLDAVAGAELTVGRINFSADFKPQVSFGGGPLFVAGSALSARYVLIKARRSPEPRIFNRKRGGRGGDDGIEWPDWLKKD